MTAIRASGISPRHGAAKRIVQDLRRFAELGRVGFAIVTAVAAILAISDTSNSLVIMPVAE